MFESRPCTFAFAFVLLAGTALADEPYRPDAQRGYEVLTKKAFLPPDFTQDVFDDLWKAWPSSEREAAAKATPEERRQMAFRKYGLIESADHPGRGPALGYVDDGKGGWVMNCLACHGGQTAGRAIAGAPNSNYALQTLMEDVRTIKVRTGRPLGHMELGMISIPLGGSNGTTNAVVFGVALEALRDADMNVRLDNPRPKYVHHDMDAPPFWNVRKKTRLYTDAMAGKSQRPLMQFILLPKNDRATLDRWENDFRDILAWIESLEPPKYPWDIDQKLAAGGRQVFERKCAQCHGTYGPEGKYPNRVVDLDVVGTDPVRLESLSDDHRLWYQRSWLSHYNQEPPAKATGYIAPPLDGIWASAPYLHNGSVPTLWHLLHPDERPDVWKRSFDGYDRERVGLEVEVLETVPARISVAERRQYFDTSLFGKSQQGHRFPNELTEPQKRAVLEYLKTL